VYGQCELPTEGTEMADDIDLTNRELEELNREVIARGGQL
jgi:hypothetical protein